MVNRLAIRCQFLENLKKLLDFLLFCATVAERFVTNDFPALYRAKKSDAVLSILGRKKGGLIFTICYKWSLFFVDMNRCTMHSYIVHIYYDHMPNWTTW